MAQQSVSELGIKNARSQTHLVRALRKIRKQKGMTVTEVANLMGVDETMVYRFEKGGTNFTMSTLRKYAKAVNAHLRLDAAPLPEPVKEEEHLRVFTNKALSSGFSNFTVLTDGVVASSPFTAWETPPSDAQTKPHQARVVLR